MTTATAIAHGLWVSILGRHQSPSSVFASCHVAFIIYQFMLQKHTPRWGASQPHSPPKTGMIVVDELIGLDIIELHIVLTTLCIVLYFFLELWRQISLPREATKRFGPAKCFHQCCLDDLITYVD